MLLRAGVACSSSAQRAPRTADVYPQRLNVFLLRLAAILLRKIDRVSPYRSNFARTLRTRQSDKQVDGSLDWGG